LAHLSWWHSPGQVPTVRVGHRSSSCRVVPRSLTQQSLVWY